MSRGYKVLDGVGECMESCWDGICSEDYGWDIPWKSRLAEVSPDSNSPLAQVLSYIQISTMRNRTMVNTIIMVAKQGKQIGQ